MEQNQIQRDANSQEWNHEERREIHRRSGNDRRDMLRFELDKDDRRSGRDRRSDRRSGWDSGTTV